MASRSPEEEGRRLRLVSASQAAALARGHGRPAPRTVQQCAGCGRRSRSRAAVYICRSCRYEGWA